MPKKIDLQIIFTINAQSTPGHFTIPVAAVRALGISDKLKNPPIHIKVQDAEDKFERILFNSQMSLKSGTEVYGPQFKEIRPNQRIKVTIDMQPPPPKTIFISHSSDDWEQHVKPLVDRLQEEKLEVWVDRYIIKKGSQWHDAINTALIECERMILCLSPKALSSKNVKMEYQYFHDQLDKGKELFPVMCEETKLPPDLHGTQYTHISQLDTLINLLKD